MEEFIELLNEDGTFSGIKSLKSEAHKKGLLHASVHIWIFDTNKNVIIQKRAMNKDVFPNLWDVSVAGHISFGENPKIAAQREVEEEIGLKVIAANLHFGGTIGKRVVHNENLIDNELHYIYMYKTDFNVTSLKLQLEEVSEIKAIKLQDLIELIHSENNNFVPHGNNYFDFIFNEITKHI